MSHDHPFCSCASCSEVMDRAYKVIHQLISENHCVSTIVGIGRAMTVVGFSMSEAEFMAIGARDGITDEDAARLAFQLSEEKQDLIDDYFDANRADIVAMGRAIYENANVKAGAKN